MAQHVTGSVTDLHAEHQLAPAEQTGNRESSGGEGLCARVLWVGGTQQGGEHGYFKMPKMKEINVLVL